MSWVVLFLVAVLVIAVTLASAFEVVRFDPMGELTRSTPSAGLPEEPRAHDVDEVRFDTALRGYRMDVVDARLDTLRDRIRELDEQLAHRPAGHRDGDRS